MILGDMEQLKKANISTPLLPLIDEGAEYTRSRSTTSFQTAKQIEDEELLKDLAPLDEPIKEYHLPEIRQEREQAVSSTFEKAFSSRPRKKKSFLKIVMNNGAVLLDPEHPDGGYRYKGKNYDSADVREMSFEEVK